MDWATYKARCDHPRVLSRWMLTRTATWVPPPVATKLRRAMEGQPLPKPPDHKGGAATDMFEVRLDAETVASILSSVERAAAGYAPDVGATSPQNDSGPAPTASLNAYLAAWREYRDAG